MLGFFKAIGVGLAFALISASDLRADSGPYFPGGQPTGMGIISATTIDSAGNPQIYGGSTGGQPDNWSFSQWNSPNDLPPLAYYSSTNEWKSGNPVSGIHYYPQTSNSLFGIDVAQNGAGIPCNDPSGNPLEFDVFASANGWAAANNPQMYPQSAQFTPTIDKVDQYNMSGNFTLVTQRYANQNNGCPVDQASAQIGIELSNTTTSPIQHFFYGIQLTNFCYNDGGTNSNYQYCQAQSQNPQSAWYWTGTAQPVPHTESNGSIDWGYNDTLSTYGGSPALITSNTQRGLALNIMPVIKNLIANNPYGMDKNISHWFAGVGTIGQALWGNVFLETRWSGWVPVYSLY